MCMTKIYLNNGAWGSKQDTLITMAALEHAALLSQYHAKEVVTEQEAAEDARAMQYNEALNLLKDRLDVPPCFS